MSPQNRHTPFHPWTIVWPLIASGFFTASVHADEYTKAYGITKRANVLVVTNDGSVTITSGESQQVEFRVDYQGYVLNRTVLIDSRQQGDQVELTARIPVRFYISLGARRRLHIAVRVPKETDLQVRTSDGSIETRGISGSIDLHSSEGAITVTSLKGSVRLNSSDGTIEASDMDGRCDASSSVGRVSIEALHGSRLDSDWSIASSDGSIEVALPADLPATIDASSRDGRIRNDNEFSMEGVMSKSNIHGKMNGGDQTLTIRTGNGSIHLKAV